MAVHAEHPVAGAMRPWWNWLWRGGLVLLAVAVVLWLLWWWAAERRLAAVQQAIVEAGLPRTLDEALPPVADEDNAALCYEEAYRLLCVDDPRQGYRPGSRCTSLTRTEVRDPISDHRNCSTWPPERWQEWRDQWYSPWFVAVRDACAAAVGRPTCRWRRPYEEGLRMVLPEIAPSRDLQRAFAIALQDPEVRADAGQWRAVARLAWWQVHHAREGAGLLIDLLVAWSLQAEVWPLLVGEGTAFIGSMTELDPLPAGRPARGALIQALDAERVIVADWAWGAGLADLGATAGMPGWLFGIYTGPLGAPVRSEDQARYLELTSRWSLDLRDGVPVHDPRPERPAIWRAPLMHLVALNIDVMLTGVDRAQAECDLLQAGLTLENFHRRQGRWPADLDELAAGLPVDSAVRLVAGEGRPQLSVTYHRSDQLVRAVWGIGIEELERQSSP